MRDTLAGLLILPGLALFVMAAIALMRFRSRGVGLAFMATQRAALVGLAVSVGVCTAGGAVAPNDQANVANLRSTDTEAPFVATTRAIVRSTTTEDPTTTTSAATVTTTKPTPTTANPVRTTAKPYVPPPTSPPATKPPGNGAAPCHPSYSPCIPDEGTDVDCAGGSGNGPRYVQGPVSVHGYDEYDLDRDGDGVACEN